MHGKELLMFYMSKSGKSRQDCANALGMHYNTFCNHLNGKKGWDVRDAITLCDFLGISDDNVKCAIFLS